MRAAAVPSLVTVPVYGFWWWDVSRQLRVLGQPAFPWRALTAVAVGLLAIVLPFLSVHRTATMIAGAQRRAGQAPALSPSTPVMSGGGGGGWWPGSPRGGRACGGLLIGVIWPLTAMLFVGYLQQELSRALGQRVAPGS